MDVTDAIAAINESRKESLDLLIRIRDLEGQAKEKPFDETFRLVSTPMLYSAWERTFSLCHSVGLRYLRSTINTASQLEPNLRAAWLQETSFYKSYVDKRHSKQSSYSTLSDFLGRLDDWLKLPLDVTVNTEDLVMTHSNVNGDIVLINAKALGIDKMQEFQALRLGRLHDLVGRRNEIGHGASIAAPTNSEFFELLEFTEKLIDDYCAVFVSWLMKDS